MKILPFLLAVLVLAGCASNPLMTGKPQHWMHKPSADLRAAWGEPTRITPQANGAEIWEYVKRGDYNAPAEDRTSFNVGGGGIGGSGFAAGGGIRTTKSKGGTTDYENLWRFMVKDGKIKKWYAQRMEGGRIVWSDH